MIMSPPLLFEPEKAISSVAELGLKLKLRKHSQVKVSISGGPSELLQGQILGVNVTGKDWMSPGMLTCRTINCAVGTARIDLGRLARGAIELTQPVRGTCSVDLTAADFANFLSHPKVAAAAAAAPPPLAGAFRFARQCRVDPAAVLFAGTWRGATVRMALAQGPGRRAAVRLLPTGGGTDPAPPEELAAALAAFFDSLVQPPPPCPRVRARAACAGRRARSLPRSASPAPPLRSRRRPRPRFGPRQPRHGPARPGRASRFAPSRRSGPLLAGRPPRRRPSRPDGHACSNL
jgi:hypothetical protein